MWIAVITKKILVIELARFSALDAALSSIADSRIFVPPGLPDLPVELIAPGDIVSLLLLRILFHRGLIARIVLIQGYIYIMPF